MRSVEIASWLLLVGAALGVAGCGDPCNASVGAPEVYAAGTVHCEGAGIGCVYETSGWHGPLLHFPGGKRYELLHHLGHEPAEVTLMIAFSGEGTAVSEPGNALAPSAGNSAELVRIDDKVIVIQNSTCAEFWVRVTASGTSATPAATDAGVDAAAADAGTGG